MVVPLRLLSMFVACFMASASANVLPLNINCGSNRTSVDGYGIKWVDDAGFVQSGESTVIQNDTSFLPPHNTLRYFPTGKKNCYTVSGIPLGSKILVRTIFNYGNYDGLQSPPTFGLQFDGNWWTEVVTGESGFFVAEMVCVVRTENVSICVARTEGGNGVPFISSLEMRPLQLDMYAQLDPDYALFVSNRLAFGARSLVRYPDDPYNRLWVPCLPKKGQAVTNVTGTESSFTTDTPDFPPAAVLRHAITPTISSGNWELPLSSFLDASTPQTRPYYLNLYFSEVVKGSGGNRSFLVYLDKASISGTIVSPLGAFHEFTCSNCTFSPTSNLALIPTQNSSLPPIINAMEVFRLSGPLVDGTYADDVTALRLFQSSYRQLQAWSGDPCLPLGYNWEWIDCSDSQPPRVTALYLQGKELTGALPDFSALTSLEVMNLADNDFDGIIPPSLTRPNLNFKCHTHTSKSLQLCIFEYHIL
ncbi:unnamed protein product [Victoria cruziana]